MKEKEISDILTWYDSGKLKHDEAVEKILLLFGVSIAERKVCPICSDFGTYHDNNGTLRTCECHLK